VYKAWVGTRSSPQEGSQGSLLGTYSWMPGHARRRYFQCYTQGDSDVISMPAGFRRHLVGKTFRNNFRCDIAVIQ